MIRAGIAVRRNRERVAGEGPLAIRCTRFSARRRGPAGLTRGRGRKAAGRNRKWEGHMKAMTAAALGLVLALAPAAVRAATMTIPMDLITDRGVGAPVGNGRAEDTGAGLKLTPERAGLPPGPHGFHLHEKPACGPGESDGMQAGLAAGGHWDPAHTRKHLGPGG